METIYTKGPRWVNGQPVTGKNILWNPHTRDLDARVEKWLVQRVAALSAAAAILVMALVVSVAVSIAVGQWWFALAGALSGACSVWAVWWSLLRSADATMPEHLIVSDSELHVYFAEAGSPDDAPISHQVWMLAKDESPGHSM